jgi:hypothetical protein
VNIYNLGNKSDAIIITIDGYKREDELKEKVAEYIMSALKDKFEVDVVVYFMDIQRGSYYEK